MGEDRTPLLEEMFQSSPDALVVVRPDGVVEVAGAAVDNIFGYRPEGIEGQPIEILLPESARAVHRVYRATYAAEPESRPMGVGRELYGRHRDGSVFPVDVSLVPTVLDGRPLFGAFVRDASERKRGEKVFRFVRPWPTTASASRDIRRPATAWTTWRRGRPTLRDGVQLAAALGASLRLPA